MSVQALAEAFAGSPLKDNSAEFVVHLAIADVVNDVYDHRFWMKRAELAAKAGVSVRTCATTIARLVEFGILEIVEQGGGRGKPTTYRYLPQTVQSPHGNPETVQSEQETVQSTTFLPSSIPKELNGRRKRRFPLSDDWEPKDSTKAWVRENYPELATKKTLNHFRDHHIAKGSVMLDWDRALMNWCRQSERFQPERVGPVR